MLVNLTPHTINVERDGEIIAIPPSGQVARVVREESISSPVMGFSVAKATLKEVAGLPQPQEGHWFVVSAMVAQATDRADLVCPDTGPGAIRDEKGHIVAVRGFVTYQG